MMRFAQRTVASATLLMLMTTAAPLAAKAAETDAAFFAISVEHFDESLEWYARHLEFTVESDSENEQRRGALLVRPGAVLEIAAFSDAVDRDSIAPNVESHQMFGIFKLGFVVDDLDAAFETLSAAGVDIFFPIVNAAGGRRTFGIRDPEGNIIQFLSDPE